MSLPAFVHTTVVDYTQDSVHIVLLEQGPPDTYILWAELDATGQADVATLVAANGGTLPLASMALADTVVVTSGKTFRQQYRSKFRVRNIRFEGIVTDRLVSVSRNALPADNGATLELVADVTYTIPDTALLSTGVALIGPVTGTATLAVSGTATLNGATTSITISAGQIVSAIPRVSSPNDYIVKGS